VFLLEYAGVRLLYVSLSRSHSSCHSQSGVLYSDVCPIINGYGDIVFEM